MAYSALQNLDTFHCGLLLQAVLVPPPLEAAGQGGGLVSPGVSGLVSEGSLLWLLVSFRRVPLTRSSNPLRVPSAIVICRGCVCQWFPRLRSMVLTLLHGRSLKCEEACLLECTISSH